MDDHLSGIAVSGIRNSVRLRTISSVTDRASIFVAFDLLHLNGKDLRTLPLIEASSISVRFIGRKRSRNHDPGYGILKF